MLFVAVVVPASSAAGLADRFRAVIERLCRGLAEHANRDWTATAFAQIIVGGLLRRLHRFVALKARFDAGMAPPLPRPPRERSESDCEYERGFDFVPRNRGWLKSTTEHDGAAAFWQLRDLLADPEMAAFIAADRRVGRLLRPLWWMLSPKLGLPDVLRLPPRQQPASSPAETARATPPPAGPQPTSRPLRRARTLLVRLPRSRPPIPA